MENNEDRFEKEVEELFSKHSASRQEDVDEYVDSRDIFPELREVLPDILGQLNDSGVSMPFPPGSTLDDILDIERILIWQRERLIHEHSLLFIEMAQSDEQVDKSGQTDVNASTEEIIESVVRRHEPRLYGELLQKKIKEVSLDISKIYVLCKLGFILTESSDEYDLPELETMIVESQEFSEVEREGFLCMVGSVTGKSFDMDSYIDDAIGHIDRLNREEAAISATQLAIGKALKLISEYFDEDKQKNEYYERIIRSTKIYAKLASYGATEDIWGNVMNGIQGHALKVLGRESTDEFISALREISNQ